MRKLVVIGTLAAMLLLIASSCGSGLKDGVYTANSNANSRGYVSAQVTIAKGKITHVELTEFDALGIEKDWEVYPYPLAKEALDELEQAFVKKNGTKVDSITGATTSSQKAIGAVDFALMKAGAKSESTGTYFDGTFMAISDQGPRGWGIAWVTLENDKITEVVLAGTMPDPDAEGKFVAKAHEGENMYPFEPYHIARVELADDIVAKGSPEVDTITSATGSSVQWIQAVERALEAAKR